MIDKFSSISTRKTSIALSILTSQKTMVAMSDYGDEHRMLKKQVLTNLLGPNPQVTSVSDDVEKIMWERNFIVVLRVENSRV
jgi:hypothetical protein